MQKSLFAILFIASVLLASCGTPNDPESIIGGDGGYKVVSKFTTEGYAQDVLVKDTIAYVTQGEGGLMIINVANHNQPRKLSSKIDSLKGNSNKIAIKDSLIFISAGSWGVSVVDVSHPLIPSVKTYNVTIKPSIGLDVMDDFVFAAIGESGFKVSKIVDINQLDPRGETFAPGFAQAVFVSTDKKYLFVACGEMGFAFYNISELQSGWGTYPMVGWIDTPGYAEDVVSHPSLPYAFLACGTGGLFVIDYSDSLNVKVVGSYSTGGYAKEIIYKDNKVYVTTEMRGLQIFDVSNLYAPTRIGTVETKYAKGLAIDDRYVYIADEQEGLIIISIP